MKNARLFSNIVITVVLALFMLLVLGMVVGMFEKGTREYVGNKTFEQLKDAIAFQNEISIEADNAKAEINSIELVKQSPPTIKWSVLMPATKYNILGDLSLPFKYGKPWSSRVTSRNYIISSFIIYPAIVGLLLYFGVWNNKNGDNK